jgi:uncharacterized repeat protein (TIGR01451 family)
VFTRLVQRKRPRWSAIVAISVGVLVAIGFAAVVVLATLVTDTGTRDLTVPNKSTSTGLVSLGTASAEYIGSSANNQASGTGLFDPFVRLQASPTEQGFNTDAPVTFDAKTGTWTHAIKVNAIPVVDCDGSGTGTAQCWELFNDINEGNNAKRISLNDVQIWFTNSATTTDGTGTTFTGFPSPATLEYHFSGDILINDVNQGSGRGDLRYLVPTAGHTWDSSTYFVLYSKWGTTTGTAGNFGTGGYSSDGGFEEWKVRKTPNVSITKTADATSVNAGNPIGFTITITNSGVADATGVTLTDALPGGNALTPVHWTIDTLTGNPAAFAISGADGSQQLTLAGQPITLAAGTSLTVHITAATTAQNCATYNNTASFTSTNAGSGSANASTSVLCGALVIKKESTKTGNPLVSTPGAVFHVTGPGGYDVTVKDNNTPTPAGSVNDEDLTSGANADGVGTVCISGLAPGAYTVNETSPPSGYGDASQTDVPVTVSNGSDCGTNEPTATAAVFTNAPLSDIQVNFKDDGSGETTATINCVDSSNNDIGSNDATPTTGWDTSETDTNLPPDTYTCTITVDP